MTYDLSKAKERFGKDLFATDVTGIEIIDVGELYAKCTLVLQPKHLNAMGAVMGGVIYTLADFAFAVAANWEKMGCVSLHSDISFLGSAKGDRLSAKAVCIKDGRSTVCYRVDVTDDLGNLTATVTATGYRVG